MDSLIINFTPTGMVPTKAMTRHVPLTVDEIVEDVLAARELGATMIHLHARDGAGRPTYRREVYAELIGRIREADGHGEDALILIVSTSGRDWSEIEKRSDSLQLEGPHKPDMASLTLSSLNFSGGASVNSPDTIMTLARMMQQRGIRPELEVFDLGMLNYARYLTQKGLIEPPYYFNLLFGNIASAQASALHLGTLLAELPDDSVWSAGGIGDHQFRMNLNAMLHGGGVRVGLEDNIWMTPRREALATNRGLLERINRAAEMLDLEIATPAEVRRRLKLAPPRAV